MSLHHYTSLTPHKGEDLERNNGSAARPYYMTAELRDILMKDADEARSPTSPAETMQLTAPDKTMENWWKCVIICGDIITFNGHKVQSYLQLLNDYSVVNHSVIM